MAEVKEFWRGDQDGVALIEEREKRRVSYDEFIQRMQTNKVTTPILPHGTIWYQSESNRSRYVIQLPPKKRTVPYYTDWFEIGCPSFVLLVNTSHTYITNMALAMAMAPIVDTGDMLFRPPIPNQQDRGHLCVGGDLGIDAAECATEIERVRKGIAHMENSRYNNHLLPRTEWVPEEFLGLGESEDKDDPRRYRYNDQNDFSSGLRYAEKAYKFVLKRWAKMTSGDDWLEVVQRIGWKSFKTFGEFVSEPM